MDRSDDDRHEATSTASTRRGVAQHLAAPTASPPVDPPAFLPPHAGPTNSSPLEPEQRQRIFRWLEEIAFPEDW
jgi:hypothetical protein